MAEKYVVRDFTIKKLNEMVNNFRTGVRDLTALGKDWYQRSDARWSKAQRLRLFDTILNGHRIGMISIAAYDGCYWILDGQQRIEGIMSLIKGDVKYSPSKIRECERLVTSVTGIDGLILPAMPEAVKRAFMSSKVSVEIIQCADGAEAAALYFRKNTNAEALNSPEKMRAVCNTGIAIVRDEICQYGYWTESGLFNDRIIASSKHERFITLTLSYMLGEPVKSLGEAIKFIMNHSQMDEKERRSVLREFQATFNVVRNILPAEDVLGTEWSKYIKHFLGLWVAVHEMRDEGLVVRDIRKCQNALSEFIGEYATSTDATCRSYYETTIAHTDDIEKVNIRVGAMKDVLKRGFKKK